MSQIQNKRNKKSKTYFTSDTEKWIVEYNISTDPVYRGMIFSEHIYYPFYKLAENLIHRFKFYYTDVDNLEDLKHDIVTLLLEEKIMKFNPEYGAKAYSYFGTIVKRWLINYNAQNYKKIKRECSTDSLELFEEDPEVYTTLNEIKISDLITRWVDHCYLNLEKEFPLNTERVVADAILTIFKTRKSINIFKKKALYIYIREMTECETPTITSTISKLKRNYYLFTKDIKDDYELTDF
jgi:hypothetical protein